MRNSSASSIETVARNVLHTEAMASEAKPKKDAMGEAQAEELARVSGESLSYLERLLRHTTPLLRTLTQGEVTVLIYLDAHTRDTSAVHIAEEVGLTRPRITQIIDELEEQGLARRIKDEHDARKIRVVITRKGKKVVAERRCVFAHIMEDFDAVLGPEDARELERLLKRTYEVMSIVNPNMDATPRD